MIDLVLVFVFCYQLHKMAYKRGISPWPYLLNYLAAFLFVAMGIGYTAMSMFGKDLLQNEEAMKKAMLLEPFAILFEVLLFLYFRNKILHAKLPADEHEDHEPPTSDDKKDLSYFR